MGWDLLVRGGTLVTATDELRVDVATRGGCVVALGQDLPCQEASRVVDAGGALVLPGGVDPHVHLSLPLAGTSSADNFTTGTAAAALGATTTLIDFVTPERGQALQRAATQRRAEADGRVVVDYGLHMSVTDWHPGIEAEIVAAVAAGMPTFKVYLAYKQSVGVDDATLLRTLRSVRAAGGRVLVHAVNGDVHDALVADLVSAGHLDPSAHPLAQPAAAEAEATCRALHLARSVGADLYVVHVTCADALRELRRARAAGGPQALGETCTQYLLLDQSRYQLPPEQAARYVLSPPLRAPSDQDALWEALAAGWLDVVATDHCPFPVRGGKDRGLHDFRCIPNGLPGVEERVDLLHTHGVLTGRLSRSRWVDLVSAGPARLMGLYPRKGTLLPGSDADLVIYDPTAERTLSVDLRPRPYDYHPYEGMKAIGKAEHVFVRGQQVVAAGRLVGEPGVGEYVGRALR